MTTTLTAVQALIAEIERMGPEFAKMLPPQVPPERFMRVTKTAINTYPDLVEADRRSLYGEIMKCAQDGLMPDGREAHINVFNTKNGKLAKYIPMVPGILKKVRNSGELSSINPQVVYEKDEFSFWVDEKGEHIKHIPKLTGERGEPAYVYCIATMKDGACYIEIMSKADVEKVRSTSRAKDAGPWKDWWSEMARKTAIRRLSKRLPMSTDLEDVIRRDDDLYDLSPASGQPKPPAEPGRPNRAAAVVGAASSEPGPGTTESPATATDGDLPI